jgi:hypothetical protein
VIGEDPWNWRPWAIAAGYAVLVIAIVVLLWIDLRGSGNIVKMTEAEAEAFRLRAEDAVYNAPEAYRYNVWKGVNARLAERGLPPLEKPIGLEEPAGIFGD